MRLETIPSAAAIILIVLASFPPVAAAATPAAVITSPAPGATILENSWVRVNYTGFHPAATSAAGYVTLDGETVATFVQTIPPGPTNGTRSVNISVLIDTTNATSGPRTLAARVFTDLDDPVDTPPVGIVLDKAPSVAVANVDFDLDARRLVVEATVHDDGGAPFVELRSLGRAVNASFQGTQTMSLAAPIGPGEYNATLRARDAHGQEKVVSFRYTVLDREADLVVDRAQYELGGKLRLEGNVSDADRAIRLEVRTPLGGADLAAPNNTTRWSMLVGVAPALGTFHGNVTSVDAWGGRTTTPFTFTIGGPNETFFERTVETMTGAYADRSSVVIPRMLGGAITICVDGCWVDEPTGTPEMLYHAVCRDHQHVVCRQVTGRPGQAGSFDLCSDAPPHGNLVAQALWTVTYNLRTAMPPGTGPCSSAFDHVNETPLEREIGLSGSDPGVSVTATLHVNGTARLVCASFGDDRLCLFDAPKGGTLELSWLQTIGREVSVRVNGVRV